MLSNNSNVSPINLLNNWQLQSEVLAHQVGAGLSSTIKAGIEEGAYPLLPQISLQSALILALYSKAYMCGTNPTERRRSELTAETEFIYTKTRRFNQIQNMPIRTFNSVDLMVIMGNTQGVIEAQSKVKESIDPSMQVQMVLQANMAKINEANKNEQDEHYAQYLRQDAISSLEEAKRKLMLEMAKKNKLVKEI